MAEPTELESVASGAPSSAPPAVSRSDAPSLIPPEKTVEEQYLRHIFVRSQMSEFAKEPFIMAKADGVHYWDVQGKRYLDALSGIYVVSVGHNNRRVIEAIRGQLDVLHFSPAMHGTNPLSVQLANRLVEVAPGDLHAVKFLSGGSESTEAAIKMARQYHKLTGNATKFKIISRYQAWHGSTMGSLSASGLRSRRAVNEPLAGGFVHVFPPTCYRCPFGKEYPSCDITCVSLIGDVIEMEGPETVAAVFVEPIGHTGGIIDPPEEYLPQLREICDRHNVLLVFDEIITGMGRTGQMFAADTFGVVPDLLCLGKGLSGGYAPLAALMCRKHIAEAFWGDAAKDPGFVEGHTFEGNPISCAAGLATLAEIVERDLCGNARRMGERLRAGLEGLRRHGIVGDIRGKGLFLGIEFVRDPATKEQFDVPIAQLIGRRALAGGLLTRFDPHWLAVGPPLVVTEEHVDEIVAILDRSTAEVLAELGATRKRRWYQFKLWHLLALVTLVAVALALVVRPAMLRKRRQTARAALEKLGVILETEGETVVSARFQREAGHGSYVTEDGYYGHIPMFEPIAISDSTLAALRWLPNIREIDLGETAVTDEGLEHLAGLYALRTLYLHGTHITSGGLVHFEGLTGLETLTLDRTRVADDGLEHLEALRNLKKLYLTDTAVTDEGIRNLKEALPGLDVVR
jgi:adenosylmethionine-8-amino-7-oxononanoate aminotransferase